MTPLPPLKQPAEEISIKIDSAYIDRVLDYLIAHSITFRADLTFSSKNKLAVPVTPVSQVLTPTEKDKKSEKYKQSDIWDKMPQFIVNKIKKGETISIEEMALRVELAPYVFKSKFAAYYGKPFYQYYLDKRMEFAADLLRRGFKGNEVAIKIGYGEKSIIKFNKMFQKHFGITPKKYQMQNS